MPSNTNINASQNLDDKYALTVEELATIAGHKKYVEDKEKEAAAKKGSWDNDSAGKTYGFMDFLRFAAPMLWKGSWSVKFVTAIMFIAMFVSRAG